MTTTEPPTETRSQSVQLRLTPSEAAPWKAQVDKDHTLSDIVRGVLNHAANGFPRARKAAFEAQLAAGEVTEIGRFDNELGEEFVIYRIGDRTEPYTLGGQTFPAPIFVTGDELGWKTGATYANGQLADVFMLSAEERKEINKILGVNKGAGDLGHKTGVRIALEMPGLDDHPNSNSYKASHSTAYWRGGNAAAEAGYVWGTDEHMEFFMGFMRGITEASK